MNTEFPLIGKVNLTKDSYRNYSVNHYGSVRNFILCNINHTYIVIIVSKFDKTKYNDT